LPERLRYHLRYSGREYLRYLGQFSDLGGSGLNARVEQELGAVGLLEAADRRLATYSKGMLQRLGIAQALLSDPDMLLIDEPTSGLDPAGQREMLDLLADVRGRNHTIFLATHFLDEIELLCDTVGILFAGKLAAEIDVQSLRAPGRSVLIKVADLSADLIERLQRISPAVRCTGREIALQPSTPALQAQVLRVLLDADAPIIALEPQGRPLEDIYMRIVRGEPAELPAAAPPHGMFAPPGHPDAITRVLESTDVTPPARSGSGDTLLRELLKQEQNPNLEKHEPESET